MPRRWLPSVCVCSRIVHADSPSGGLMLTKSCCARAFRASAHAQTVIRTCSNSVCIPQDPNSSAWVAINVCVLFVYFIGIRVLVYYFLRRKTARI